MAEHHAESVAPTRGVAAAAPTTPGAGSGSPAAAPSSARSADDDVIYVSGAQVKAAQLLVDLAQRRNEAVDPAVAAIASAQRVNGHTVTSAALATSTPLARSRSADPSPA